MTVEQYETKIAELEERLRSCGNMVYEETSRANRNRQSLHLFTFELRWLLTTKEIEDTIDKVYKRQNAPGILLPLGSQFPIYVDISRIVS